VIQPRPVFGKRLLPFCSIVAAVAWRLFDASAMSYSYGALLQSAVAGRSPRETQLTR